MERPGFFLQWLYLTQLLDYWAHFKQMSLFYHKKTYVTSCELYYG